MKIKNVNISFLILTGLLLLSLAFFTSAQNESNGAGNIFLDSDQDGLTDEEERLYGTNPRDSDSDGDGYSDGAEVASGYDPLKKSPGDKLPSPAGLTSKIQPEVRGIEAAFQDSSEPEDNLTQQVAQKISAMTEEGALEEETISVSDIKSMVDSILAVQDIEEELPQISVSEINVKKQNYKNLSKEDAKEKEREDFKNYVIAIYYILASNSPEPITSASNLSSIMGNFSLNVISAITTRDASSLDKFSQSGEKILEQMREVEVPENLTDLHIEALSLAEYTTVVKDKVTPKANDPLGEIANLSKVQNFLGLLANFSVKIESKFLEYDLFYDEEVRKKIESFGLIAPGMEDLSSSAITGGLSAE